VFMTIFILPIILGIILLGIAVYLIIQFNKLSRIGVLTEGEVIRLDSSSGFDSRLYYPVVKFNTISGENVIHTYKIGMFPANYKTGMKVTIVYNPNKPSNFIIKSRYSLLIPLATLLVSLSLLGIGTIKLLDIQFK